MRSIIHRFRSLNNPGASYDETWTWKHHNVPNGSEPDCNPTTQETSAWWQRQRMRCCTLLSTPVPSEEFASIFILFFSSPASRTNQCVERLTQCLLRLGTHVIFCTWSEYWVEVERYVSLGLHTNKADNRACRSCRNASHSTARQDPCIRQNSLKEIRSGREHAPHSLTQPWIRQTTLMKSYVGIYTLSLKVRHSR